MSDTKAGREITLEVGGISIRAAVLDHEAPMAASLLWSALPIRATLMQSRWSGEATYAVVPALRVPTLAIENPATFMYPGSVHIGTTKGNLGLPYGQAQSRDVGGDNTWGTHVATLVGDARPFLDALREIVRTGGTEIAIGRLEGQR